MTALAGGPRPSRRRMGYDLEFSSMGDFADAVDQAFADAPTR